MTLLDWTLAVFLLVLLSAAAFGVPRPGSRDPAQRFAAGRTMPWYLLGGSLAATSLSTDTPLLVSGALYAGGLSANWFWLASAPGVLATPFFFARYWRRSGVLTEVEILLLRYGERPPTQAFRLAKAVTEGVLINILVLASVMFAAALLIERFMGLSSAPLIQAGPVGVSPVDMATFGLIAITAGYTLTSGFRAVIRTDIMQFTAAILASILLAVFAMQAAGDDFGSLSKALAAVPGRADLFNLFPAADASVLLLIAFGWWHIAPGNGLFVQRLVSARSESDATLTVFCFTALHFIIRAWPWFIIGALALIYFPGLTKPEAAYALMADRLMPTGGKGLMAAALWAGFMSTIDSRLNWGASYVVNDCCQIFGYRPGPRGERRIETTTVLLLAVGAFWIASSGAVTSILGIYQYVMILQAGTAFAAIARWYWWRLSIWGEISALVSGIVAGNVIVFMIDLSNATEFGLGILANMVVGGTVAASVSWLNTRTGPDTACRNFYRRTQVAGPGWNRLRDTDENPPSGLGQTVLYWLLSVGLVYASIAVVAALLSGDTGRLAWSLAALAACAGILVLRRTALVKALDFRDVVVKPFRPDAERTAPATMPPPPQDSRSSDR